MRFSLWRFSHKHEMHRNNFFSLQLVEQEVFKRQNYHYGIRRLSIQLKMNWQFSIYNWGDNLTIRNYVDIYGTTVLNFLYDLPLKIVQDRCYKLDGAYRPQPILYNSLPTYNECFKIISFWFLDKISWKL